MRSPISVALILVLALQFLGTGCLGTFKSKASSSSSNVSVQISGRASAAPIKNATVNLYLLNIAGTRVRLLANGTTDASGNFSLTFVSSSATLSQVVIEIGVTDGSYTEEAGGSTVSFALDQFRSRTVFDGTSQTMVVTPITEIAAARADALVAGGMDIATATAQANAEMAEASGLTNIISTLPADPTVAVTDPTSQSALYGVLLAGISQFGSALGINSVQVTDALKTDFSDAVFDGLSPTSTSVVLADVALTPLSFTGWSTGMTAAIN
ncbi:MAG: hypothetical protein ACXVA9_09745, partial [Bdellovibrionales bacterium]